MLHMYVDTYIFAFIFMQDSCISSTKPKHKQTLLHGQVQENIYIYRHIYIDIY